ncbi:hypothetical protein ACFVW1_48165 [Streptomyces olivochromogenes]|uniref:hypothetical protein n=1 Tax=Streptomyces olivochromogenes TaxID=1963 RepID=UPI0036DC601B
MVYSIGQKRVWLVNENGKTLSTFNVWPGTVDPEIGSKKVSYRREKGTGSDGVPIEHAVYFGNTSAFSHAVDGASPSPNPSLRSGAIRERITDGTALWKFAKIGTTVCVVK